MLSQEPKHWSRKPTPALATTFGKEPSSLPGIEWDGVSEENNSWNTTVFISLAMEPYGPQAGFYLVSGLNNY